MERGFKLYFGNQYWGIVWLLESETVDLVKMRWIRSHWSGQPYFLKSNPQVKYIAFELNN